MAGAQIIRMPTPTHNHLLRDLQADVQRRLFAEIHLIHLSSGEVLHEAGDRPAHVYFPTHAVLTQSCLMENGDATAVAVVGNDGVVDVSSILQRRTTWNRSLVCIAGHAYRLPMERFLSEFGRYGEFAEVLLRYSGKVMNQISQTAVCYRHHSISQQLCRWLLLLLDRLPDNRIAMTQASIALMLGVRREGVTDAAGDLRRSGAIRYRRGVIEVMDRPYLEAMSCECYRALRRGDASPGIQRNVRVASPIGDMNGIRERTVAADSRVH